MTHSGSSAFDEVNEKVAQAGELLKIKPGVIKALSSLNVKLLSLFR